VAGAQVGGRDRGPRGRWALLRHRPGPEREDVTDDAAGAQAAEGEPDSSRQDDATLR
jgi:hypothetical protein